MTFLFTTARIQGLALREPSRPEPLKHVRRKIAANRSEPAYELKPTVLPGISYRGFPATGSVWRRPSLHATSNARRRRGASGFVAGLMLPDYAETRLPGPHARRRSADPPASSRDCLRDLAADCHHRLSGDRRSRRRGRLDAVRPPTPLRVPERPTSSTRAVVSVAWVAGPPLATHVRSRSTTARSRSVSRWLAGAPKPDPTVVPIAA